MAETERCCASEKCSVGEGCAVWECGVGRAMQHQCNTGFRQCLGLEQLGPLTPFSLLAQPVRPWLGSIAVINATTL